MLGGEEGDLCVACGKDSFGATVVITGDIEIGIDMLTCCSNLVICVSVTAGAGIRGVSGLCAGGSSYLCFVIVLVSVRLSCGG